MATATQDDAAAPEPSGPAWVARFPTSARVDDCVEPCHTNFSAFTCGVLEFVGGATDIPHGSDDGH